MTINVFNSISQISAAEWGLVEPPDFPFGSYHFLHALETTDCLGERTGWQPRYIVAQAHGRLCGAAVYFLKTNSYGEYIFDFAWAEAHHAHGVPYYPKLISAIPFTPATGPKILLDPGLDPAAREATARKLLRAVDELAAASGVSSVHALFFPAEEIPFYEADGFFIRHSFQFHWRNSDYHSFADFLSHLRGKRRKEIVRERAQVAAQNLTISRLTGASLRPEHAEIFYAFYIDTIEKRGSFNYLTFAFFKKIFAEMKDSVLLVLAQNAEGLPVAGALNYLGRSTLFGRNWGCLADYRSLHFEMCYYQGLEFAIERGFTRFEAGAQGEHKFNRGFLPSLTYSAHKIREPRLDQAIQNHVAYEKAQIAAVFRDYAGHNPFNAEAAK